MSTYKPIDVIVTDKMKNDGELLLGSPAVGRFGSAPRIGESLVGGSRVGSLKSLGRIFELLLPLGLTGRWRSGRSRRGATRSSSDSRCSVWCR